MKYFIVSIIFVIMKGIPILFELCFIYSTCLFIWNIGFSWKSNIYWEFQVFLLQLFQLEIFRFWKLQFLICYWRSKRSSWKFQGFFQHFRSKSMFLKCWKKVWNIRFWRFPSTPFEPKTLDKNLKFPGSEHI